MPEKESVISKHKKVIAYLRVSTIKQDLDSQKLEILTYAHKRGINVDQFIQVEISSRQTPTARKIEELIANFVIEIRGSHSRC